MEFTLRTDMDNDALISANDGSGDGSELARILRSIADRVDMTDVGPTAGKVRDYNGNTVGEWRVTTE